MAKVFVVFGMSGEYSDRSEWPVRAYESQAEAQACVDRCNAYAKTAPPDDYTPGAWDRRKQWTSLNPDDPSMTCYSGGTEYGLYEIGLVKSEDTR